MILASHAGRSLTTVPGTHHKLEDGSDAVDVHISYKSGGKIIEATHFGEAGSVSGPKKANWTTSGDHVD